jgi:hypothetical protein
VKPVEERRARSEEQHPAASIWRQDEAKVPTYSTQPPLVAATVAGTGASRPRTARMAWSSKTRARNLLLLLEMSDFLTSLSCVEGLVFDDWVSPSA